MTEKLLTGTLSLNTNKRVKCDGYMEKKESYIAFGDHPWSTYIQNL